MGIGISFFTEGVGAGPRKHMDILGLGMADGCELRVHPTGKAQLRLSVQTQGQGHETTFAQIVAHELGIPPEDIEVDPRRHRQHPVRARHLRLALHAGVRRGRGGGRPAGQGQGRIIAAAALECSPDDLEWEHGRWFVKGDPDKAKTIQEIALAAHGSLELPEGVEGHLDATAVYDPPNLTYPFGAYICVVDVDAGTGQVKVRRFIAVDDCGPRINPMIVEGQVHGGLADGVGMALMEVIAFDEEGTNLGGSFMDYLLPTSMECPSWELGETVTPSPHHPLGVKGIGESATVGSPAAVVNAVLDAIQVRHADMPLTPAVGVACDAGLAAAHRPGDRVSPAAGHRSCRRGPRSRRARELRAARVPFVHARVVLAERPTSAKPGDEALVLGDGTIEGFVGGDVRGVDRARAVARDCSTRASRCCCASPRSRRTTSPASWSCTTLPVGRHARDLPRAVGPRPAGDVVGTRRSPRRCSTLGSTSATSCVPHDGRCPAGRRRGRRRLARSRDEEPVLTAALEAGVGYVGLVASPKRGEAVVAALEVDDDLGTGSTPRPGSTSAPAPRPRSRCRSSPRSSPSRPRAVGRRPRPVPPEPRPRAPAGRPTTAIDPVCGMSVAMVETSLHLDHDGDPVWFCGSGCKRAFAADPTPTAYGA
jgi:YHS domain-containing protein